MHHIQERPIDYSCPYCEGTNIETVATTPYVRGFLIAFQIGTKSFIGCTACVRRKVLGEAGRSSLLGWFSTTSLLINPFLITYNLIQTCFIKTDYAKARKKLNDAGIPENQFKVNTTRLGYSLATSMMTVDGKIDAREVEVALRIGKSVFYDFDEREFREVAKIKDLPSPQDIATLLREVLTDSAKKAVCSYLWMIAKADGKMATSETRLMAEITTNMGLDATALDRA